MPAKVMPNGKVHAPDEDIRLLLQRLIDAGGVPPRVSPGYDKSDPRKGHGHAGRTNGASVWSQEPALKPQKLGGRLSSAAQAIRRLAGRITSSCRVYYRKVAGLVVRYYRADICRGFACIDIASVAIIVGGIVVAVLLRVR